MNGYSPLNSADVGNAAMSLSKDQLAADELWIQHMKRPHFNINLLKQQNG